VFPEHCFPIFFLLLTLYLTFGIYLELEQRHGI